MLPEPAWSQAISSNTVCSWFFFLAAMNAFSATLVVLLVLVAVGRGKFTSALLLPMLGVSLGFVNAWALFLVCNSGLKSD